MGKVDIYIKKVSCFVTMLIVAAILTIFIDQMTTSVASYKEEKSIYLTIECDHENVEWTDNDYARFQVCIDCGEEIEETIEKHSYVNGECEFCGKEDNTKSVNVLPDTGEKTVFIAIIMLVAVMIIVMIKIRKYKEI